MMRITFIELALIATPFLLFFLYRAVVGRKRSAAGEAMDETPYQILFLTGSAVALASLIAVVLLGRDSDPVARNEQIYIPPRTVDGRIEPGHFISREEAIARGLIVERRRTSQDPDAPLEPEESEAAAPQTAPEAQ